MRIAAEMLAAIRPMSFCAAIVIARMNELLTDKNAELPASPLSVPAPAAGFR
jgi:hypothetical protein